MGLYRRFGDIISANLNELLDRFEDPEKMLRQVVREMEESRCFGIERSRQSGCQRKTSGKTSGTEPMAG